MIWRGSRLGGKLFQIRPYLLQSLLFQEDVCVFALRCHISDLINMWLCNSQQFFISFEKFARKRKENLGGEGKHGQLHFLRNYNDWVSSTYDDFLFFLGEAEIIWSETCQSYKSWVILPENMNRGGSFDWQSITYKLKQVCFCFLKRVKKIM